MIHLLLAVIYISFISLGLPDSVLGSAWPTIYPEFDVPVSYAGIVSMIICLGTIYSSLQCDRLTNRLGTGKVTACSVGLTAIALWGFSVSDSFLQLCLWAIPYGLGAGCVDAALNNYVALHYASRHMSWLHCMWGVGAAAGPYIMSWVLMGGQTWNMGYGVISVLQAVLTGVLFVSLPLWKGRDRENDSVGEGRLAEESLSQQPLTLKQIVGIPGVRQILMMFFCYCALESTAGLWASSYLTLFRGLDEVTAASWGSLFYVGITVGRAFNGFLTLRFTDDQLIRLGQMVIGAGCVILFLPLGQTAALAGLIMIGLGCAPIYPSVIHSTPVRFGAEQSQAIIGVQMASAYVGSCLMPPLFGILAEWISPGLYPCYLLVILVLMLVMHIRLCHRG